MFFGDFLSFFVEYTCFFAYSWDNIDSAHNDDFSHHCV